MKNLKVVFFGSPQFVTPIAESLKLNFDLVSVVTAPDQRVGRNHELTPTAIKSWAEKNNIPVLTPDSNEELADKLSAISFDLFVVAAYGKIISASILDLPRNGALNIHPSLLPKYRGASPIQSTILNGDKMSGISVIKMDSQMDHGPIVYMQKLEVKQNDTFESVAQKYFQTAAEILPGVINDYLTKKIVLQPQDDNQATHTKIIKKDDGYFDIDKPTSIQMLDRTIRAYYPWPTAWTRWEGKIVKFLPEWRVQIEGKNPVLLKDFLNGYPKFPLKKLFPDLPSTTSSLADLVIDLSRLFTD